MKLPSAKQYAAAFLKASFNKVQKKALMAVYSLPDHKATAQQVASLVGFKGWQASNLAFGLASRKVAKLLELTVPEGNDYWSVLAEGDGSGIEFIWKLHEQVVSAIEQIGWHEEANFFIPYPDETGGGSNYYEGAGIQVRVTIYERSREARDKCVRHYGCKCSVCGFDFESFYGEIGRDYIHVHHLVLISKNNGEKYVVDPIKDLIPVCPNCHAMLHTNPPPSIEDLRRRIRR